MQKILFLAMFLILISSLTCGGNCPKGDCATCDCGSNKQFPDLQQACQYRAWDVNCCKCIVTRISTGNENYMVSEGGFGRVTRSRLAGLNYT